MSDNLYWGGTDACSADVLSRAYASVPLSLSGEVPVESDFSPYSNVDDEDMDSHAPFAEAYADVDLGEESNELAMSYTHEDSTEKGSEAGGQPLAKAEKAGKSPAQLTAYDAAELCSFFDSVQGEVLSIAAGAYVARGDRSQWIGADERVSSARTRDWNDEFQSVLGMPNGLLKYTRLRNLEHDFVYCAETYGRIIISEHCLPAEQRTIRPIDIGGIAGGLKFICQGILFKFSVDTCGLYGGDENAMKAASHDLKGLMNLFHSAPHLHYPLMAFIDFRGFRLMAVSVLPISSASIKYGSADAGQSMHCDIEELNDIMYKLGNTLNLKEHRVGPNLFPVTVPADLEAHVGSDDRYYLLDFARLAPPQPPSRSGEQLYKLFRMEFVRSYEKPLCADGFSRLGMHEYKNHARELVEAYSWLLSNNVPALARKLSSAGGLELCDIGTEFHRGGLNLRHIGLVRSLVTDEQVKSVLLTEAVARTLKSHLATLLREKMKTIGVPSDEPYRRTALDFLNLVISFERTRSQEYWNVFVRLRVEEKYPRVLSDEERSPSHNLWSSISIVAVLNRLIDLAALTVSPGSLEAFKRDPRNFEFVEPDLKELRTRVGHLNLVDYADGMALYYEALNRSESDGKRRLLLLARKRLEASISSMSTNYIATLQLGSVLREMATHLKSNYTESFNAAARAFELVLESPSDVALKLEAYYRWAELCVVRYPMEGKKDAYIAQAISLCDRGLELEPACAQLIRMRAEAYLRLFGGMAAAEETIEKLDTVETALASLIEGEDEEALNCRTTFVKLLLAKGNILLKLQSNGTDVGKGSHSTATPEGCAKYAGEMVEVLASCSPSFDVSSVVSVSSDFNDVVRSLSLLQYAPTALLLYYAHLEPSVVKLSISNNCPPLPAAEVLVDFAGRMGRLESITVWSVREDDVDAISQVLVAAVPRLKVLTVTSKFLTLHLLERVLSHASTSLEKLNLSDCTHESLDAQAFQQTLDRTLPSSVTSLHLQRTGRNEDGVSDGVMEVVCRRCPAIDFLNLGCPSIGSGAFKAIQSLKHLRFLSIAKSEITDDDLRTTCLALTNTLEQLNVVNCQKLRGSAVVPKLNSYAYNIDSVVAPDGNVYLFVNSPKTWKYRPDSVRMHGQGNLGCIVDENNMPRIRLSSESSFHGEKVCRLTIDKHTNVWETQAVLWEIVVTKMHMIRKILIRRMRQSACQISANSGAMVNQTLTVDGIEFNITGQIRSGKNLVSGTVAVCCGGDRILELKASTIHSVIDIQNPCNVTLALPLALSILYAEVHC